MNMFEEVYTAVSDLNELLFTTQGYQSCFECSSDGFQTSVLFLGSTIWSSEMDEREFYEETNEYEPLFDHLKIAAKAHVKRMQDIVSVFE